MPLAATLADALDVLELHPLEFAGGKQDPESNPLFYVEPPPREQGAGGEGLSVPGLAEHFRTQLLGHQQPAKIFLSGHIGSGKSTQINKLAADDALHGAFSVVLLRIEADLLAFLDTPQLLFLLAGAIYEFGREAKLLTEGARWKGILRDVDARIYGEKGVVAKESTLSAEFDLLFVKIREELKLMEHRRRQFRELGETQKTLLLDLVKALTLDVETQLVAKGKHNSLLLLVDDLDKVREPAQQEDIFNTNVGLLHALPFHALFTVPTGVVFGPNRAEVRAGIDHIYPVRVLGKAPDGFDPEHVFVPGSDAFFRRVLDRRVEPQLFDDASVRLAAIYSGGVLREFFRLLRSAVDIARHNKLVTVDVRALRTAVREERLRETRGLLGPDYDALREIHRTHRFAEDAQRRYLDEARVLECYNDRNWYEANPLLWKVLQPEV